MTKIDDIPALNFSNVDDLDGTTAFDAPPDLEIEDLKIDDVEIEEKVVQVNDAVETNTFNDEADEDENVEEGNKIENPDTKSYAEDEGGDGQDGDKDGGLAEPDFDSSFSMNFSKKMSYDTIQSLNLDGNNSRKNTGDSDEIVVENKKTAKFTLSDAVEDETNTDTLTNTHEEKILPLRPSFTKVLAGKAEDRKASLQVERINSRQFDRKSSLQNIKINFDEEDDNADQNKIFEETIEEEVQAEENEKKVVEEEVDKSTLVNTEDRKPFIKIKRVNTEKYNKVTTVMNMTNRKLLYYLFSAKLRLGL